MVAGRGGAFRTRHLAGSITRRHIAQRAFGQRERRAVIIAPRAACATVPPQHHSDARHPTDADLPVERGNAAAKDGTTAR